MNDRARRSDEFTCVCFLFTCFFFGGWRKESANKSNISTFAEEEIDGHNFKVLTGLSVEKIFTKLGPRDRFLQNSINCVVFCEWNRNL